jgi:CRP-like cAMP-binding protein
MRNSIATQVCGRVPRNGPEAPIHTAGSSGPCWRIRSGSVRLSRPTDDGPVFAGIVCAGELLGSEALIFGSYAYDAWPLGDVELDAWSSTDSTTLLQGLVAAEERTATVLSLRAGEASKRIHRLFQLLAGNRSGHATVFIPSLADMAEMTSLQPETISRVLSQWRRLGALRRFSRNRGCIEFDALTPLAVRAA